MAGKVAQDRPPVAIVETALIAHDLGSRIIAANWNEALTNARVDVSIACDPPSPRATMQQARNALRNALAGLRPYLDDLPPDERLTPWTLGYVHPAAAGKTLLLIPLVGHAAIGHDIKRAVDRLKGTWGPGEWRTYVVDAINKHWQTWEWRTRIEAMRPLDAGKPKRRRSTSRQPRKLTNKQIEAMQIVGECKGNIAKAADQVGIDRKSMKERYDAALAKMRKVGLKHSTMRLALDRRGQSQVTAEDDRRR